MHTGIDRSGQSGKSFDVGLHGEGPRNETGSKTHITSAIQYPSRSTSCDAGIGPYVWFNRVISQGADPERRVSIKDVQTAINSAVEGS